MIMDLFTAAGHDHDLPPKWDGRKVTWGQWQSTSPTTVDFHLPANERSCTECGSLADPDTNRGKVAAHWDETEVVEEVRRTKSGREYVRDVERPARQKTTLVALRCPDCDHDQVLDMTTSEAWDLDSSDYTDTGSWEGQ